MQNQQIEDVITQFDFLADISPEDWKEISILSLPANSVVHDGEFLKYTFLILEGSIRIYKLNDKGKEVALFRINSGECCPLMLSSILGHNEFEASACIEKPTTVLIVKVQILQEWMDKYKNFRQFIFRSLAHYLNTLSILIENIYFKSIRTRIYEYLIENTNFNNDSLSITHDILSIELRTTREVTSRTLKAMEKEGLLRLERGQITHIQHQKLLILLNN
ncbi:Crp/Fnr family transcriptional regulator [Paenibacillus tyrfis]|uniref:Crp/Fnr family transcriptional regulator n=1 Tax=Paenibacillus tyrfis TaxID=1501230 RepID=UPI00209ED394|nr:Crp/Fnr family transcriptional regulator [Paenibacillus tyrfis]MCP1311578.1 Crp/Fnr family transcriptional regulator [Paenibacillus tyrfis]